MTLESNLVDLLTKTTSQMELNAAAMLMLTAASPRGPEIAGLLQQIQLGEIDTEQAVRRFMQNDPVAG